MRTHESVYALYKGDKFLDIGTQKELAARTGKSINTIRFLASDVNKKRIKAKGENNGLLMIKIGSTDDNLEAKYGK